MTGGEDVWLLREIVEEKNVPLIWVPAALVFEQVSPDRCTVQFINHRKYFSGMLRCVVQNGGTEKNRWFRITQWMLIGAAQVLIFRHYRMGTEGFSPWSCTCICC